MGKKTKIENRKDGKGTNPLSHLALLDASSPEGGALLASTFRWKKLPLRGSWQSRKALTERVRSCKKAAAQHFVRQPGSICCFIFQNILPAAGFAVIAPVGVIKVCGAGSGRCGRLGFGGAVKGKPGGGAAGFDAEAHLQRPSAAVETAPAVRFAQRVSPFSSREADSFSHAPRMPI